MELCSGPTLQCVLDGRGALSEVERPQDHILLRPCVLYNYINL
jgi:hypothetical protein